MFLAALVNTKAARPYPDFNVIDIINKPNGNPHLAHVYTANNINATTLFGVCQSMNEMNLRRRTLGVR